MNGSEGKTCWVCGAEIRPSAKYCGQCGGNMGRTGPISATFSSLRVWFIVPALAQVGLLLVLLMTASYSLLWAGLLYFYLGPALAILMVALAAGSAGRGRRYQAFFAALTSSALVGFLFALFLSLQVPWKR